MARYNNFMNQTPDASYGLIFRVNNLWQRSNDAAIAGKFDKWDAILDRIYIELSYHDKLEEVRDTEGVLTDVRLNQDDQEMHDQLNKKVYEARRAIRIARKKKNAVAFHQGQLLLYKALMIKEMGLRKLMFRLKLYYKESDSNPSRSMFGGG